MEIPKLGEKEFKILNLIKQKKKQIEIARDFKVSRAYISKIFKKFRETGLIKNNKLTKNGDYFLQLYKKIR